jgi:hypothetical protein
MEEALAAEADGLVRFVARREGKRFERFRVVTHDGIAVAFYRRVDSTSSRDASILAVLLDEGSPGRWDALSASELRPDGSRAISMRPSERGDWIVAVYGSAPERASVAAIDVEGRERRVPVGDGVFAFMLRAATEPEATTTRARFE